jgi:hypothetical protein
MGLVMSLLAGSERPNETLRQNENRILNSKGASIFRKYQNGDLRAETCLVLVLHAVTDPF